MVSSLSLHTALYYLWVKSSSQTLYVLGFYSPKWNHALEREEQRYHSRSVCSIEYVPHESGRVRVGQGQPPRPHPPRSAPGVTLLRDLLNTIEMQFKNKLKIFKYSILLYFIIQNNTASKTSS